VIRFVFSLNITRWKKIKICIKKYFKTIFTINFFIYFISKHIEWYINFHLYSNFYKINIILKKVCLRQRFWYFFSSITILKKIVFYLHFVPINTENNRNEMKVSRYFHKRMLRKIHCIIKFLWFYKVYTQVPYFCAAKTISLTNGTVQTCTLTNNCTFTMPTATAGKSFTLFLNTGAGSFTSTFTSVKWSGGTAPTITVTASKVDIISFVSDGTSWYGAYSQNY